MNDETTKTDAEMIRFAQQSGACVYSWSNQRNCRSLYALPDGTGLFIEDEWGGAGKDRPWARSYVQHISAVELAAEVRRYNSHREYDGLATFENPFLPDEGER